MMNEKTKRFLKKNGLKIWIVIAVLSLSGMFAYAAYTNQQNKAKKVISTDANSEMRFSSNYLESGATKIKTVVVQDDVLTVPVSVRNYGRNNPTIWYSSTITYNISFELTDTSGRTVDVDTLIGDDHITVSCNGVTKTLTASHISDTFTGQTLAYSTSSSSQNTYSVTFPSAETKVCVRIIATPSNEHPDLVPLSAILSVSDKSSVQSEGWTGAFTDSRTSKNPDDYDAYNYSFTGYGDSNSATFSWNSNKLEVNRQYFKATFGVDPTLAPVDASGIKTVTISLDSQTSGGRYDFQIYKNYNGTTPVSISSWIELDGFVSFDDGI